MAMKKIFYLMSLCALAFISCQKEEMAGNDSVDGKYTYEFVAYQQPEAKATIGDKVDGQWPVLWSAGDQMGVYKADGTFVGVASLNEGSAGRNEGAFTMSSSVGLAAGDQLHFSYPYVENAAISTGKIAAKQTLGASGVGANAVAYAEVAYNPAGTQFVLTHKNAYLKFNVKSEEFAGYNLVGVTLWATGAELSGDVTVAEELTVTNAGDYVKSTLATPVAVSADQAQPVWVTALPGNLTGKTVYAIVHMAGVEGTETATHTVTLPVRLNGAGALPAGTVTEITLPSLTKSLSPAWYEPLETRYIAAYGDGWCYGDENTVVFTGYKTDAVQTVDLKARGNFMKVTEPKKVRVKYLNGLNDCTSPLGVYVDGTCITTYAAGTGAETFSTAGIGSTYTISVSVDNHKYLSATSGSAGYISAMEILDVDDNVIWGINLWLRLKALGEIQYANGIIMDRNLGVDEKGDAYTWRASGNYFQWGRPFALQSQSNAYTKKHFTKAEATAVTSLEVSAANPFTLYYYAAGASYKDWYYGDGTTSRENDLDDLWGNPGGNWSSKGVKSIYDPCPHGWMVASPAILKEVSDGLASDATFTSGTYPYITYNGAVWGYAGAYTCDGYNSGINWKAIGQLFAYWSNASTLNSGYANCIYTATYAAAPAKFDTSFSKARAMSIRCMKDTENR